MKIVNVFLVVINLIQQALFVFLVQFLFLAVGNVQIIKLVLSVLIHQKFKKINNLVNVNVLKDIIELQTLLMSLNLNTVKIATNR